MRILEAECIMRILDTGGCMYNEDTGYWRLYA